MKHSKGTADKIIEFNKLLDELGPAKAKVIVDWLTGSNISRNTFGLVAKGECKPSMLFLLTFVMQFAVKFKDYDKSFFASNEPVDVTKFIDFNKLRNELHNQTEV